MKKTALLLFFMLSLIACEKDDETNPHENQIDVKLEELYENSELPGFSIAVLNDQKITYQNSLGLADIQIGKEFTSETIQNIGSISKTLIALAMMKAVEQGKLDLDTDINKYLPFTVLHPRYPEKSITVRHLATHTSGIIDEQVYVKSYVLENPASVDTSTYPEDYQPIMELVKMNSYMDDSQFLENVLAVGGDWYTEDSFSDDAPGMAYEYSNIAAALAAFVVESATGIPYEEYTRTYIFKPLQMNATGWSFNEINMHNHATLYYTKDFEVPRYSLITKADGGLLTNTSDLSKFLMEMIKGYKGKGKLLNSVSYKTMFSNQSENGIQGAEGGIFWDIEEGKIHHSGGDPGIITFALFDPERNRGQIFMTNISEDFDDAIVEDIEKIWIAVYENDF